MKHVGLIILALIIWVMPKSVFAQDQVLLDMIGPNNDATNFMPVISTCNNLNANPPSIFTTVVSYATPVNKEAKLSSYQMVVSDIDSVGQPTKYSEATYTLRIWPGPVAAVQGATSGTIANCEIDYSQHITEITHYGWRDLVPGWTIPTSLLTLDISHCDITIPANSAVVLGVHAEILGDEWGRVMYSHSNINNDLPVYILDHSSGSHTITETSEVGARLWGTLHSTCGNGGFPSMCDEKDISMSRDFQ